MVNSIMKWMQAFCLLFLLSAVANAQTPSSYDHSNCGLLPALEKVSNKDPDLKNRMKIAGKLLSKQMLNRQRSPLDTSNAEIKIPVVFHVLYATENSPEYTGHRNLERIKAALDSTNQYFKGLKVCPDIEDCNDPLLGSLNVNFELAEKDPNGHPTTGIVFTKSYLTNKGLGGDIGLQKLIMWDRSKYLNVYVVNKATSLNNSGVAHYPETSHVLNPNDPASEQAKFYDGVVMAHWAVNPDDSNRQDYHYILAHEIGHWLGLRHIWGNTNAPGLEDNCLSNNDDFSFLETYVTKNDLSNQDQLLFEQLLAQFNDTPPTKGFTSVRDTIVNPAEVSCGSETPFVDNFMDYVHDASRFSPGQMTFGNFVLNSSIADRNLLSREENIQDKFYMGNLPSDRVVFENDYFDETVSNSGSFTQTIPFQIIGDNLQFQSFLNGSNLSTSRYKLTGLPAGLSLNIQINSSTSGILRITGNANEHIEDTDFLLEFNQSVFKNIPLNLSPTNLTKVFRIDFIERSFEYEDLPQNFFVGPEADAVRFVEFPFANPIIQHENGQFLVKFVESDFIELCVKSNGSQEAKLFTNDNPTMGSGDTFSSTLSQTGFEINTDLLDDGQIFYLAFKTATNQIFWIKSKWNNSNNCQAIELLDKAYYNAISNFPVVIGRVPSTDLTATLSDNFIREIDNEMTEIELKLVSSNPNYKFKSSLVNAGEIPADLFMISLEEGINPISGDLQDNPMIMNSSDLVQILLSDDKTASIKLNSSRLNLSTLNEYDDFKFRIIWNDESAIFQGNYQSFQFANDGLITVDFRGENQVEWAMISGIPHQSRTSVQSFASEAFQLRHLQNELGPELGILTLPNEEGYLFFKAPFLPYRIEVLSTNPAAINPQAVMFKKIPNDLEELVAAENFVNIGGGGRDFDGVPDPGEITISAQQLEITPEGINFIYARFRHNCDESTYAWIITDKNDQNELSILGVAYETEFNKHIQELNGCTMASYNSGNPFIWIDEVELKSGFNKVMTSDSGPSNYSDFRESETLDVNAGLALQGKIKMAASGSYNRYVSIWCDWNENGIFNKSEGELIVDRKLSSTETADSIIFSATLATNFISGKRDLRIVLSMNPDIDDFACGSFQFGEVEDYAIQIPSVADQYQTMNLSPGINWVSACVQPINDATVSQIFEPLLGKIEYIRTMQRLEIEEEPLNYNFTTGEGTDFVFEAGVPYQIRMTTEDSIVLNGVKLDIDEHNFELKYGGNYFAYPLEYPMAPTDFFNGMIDKVEYIEHPDYCEAFVPDRLGGVDGIGLLLPGKTYFVRVNQKTTWNSSFINETSNEEYPELVMNCSDIESSPLFMIIPKYEPKMRKRDKIIVAKSIQSGGTFTELSRRERRSNRRKLNSLELGYTTYKSRDMAIRLREKSSNGKYLIWKKSLFGIKSFIGIPTIIEGNGPFNKTKKIVGIFEKSDGADFIENEQAFHENQTLQLSFNVKQDIEEYFIAIYDENQNFVKSLEANLPNTFNQGQSINTTFPLNRVSEGMVVRLYSKEWLVELPIVLQ